MAGREPRTAEASPATTSSPAHRAPVTARRRREYQRDEARPPVVVTQNVTGVSTPLTAS